MNLILGAQQRKWRKKEKRKNFTELIEYLRSTYAMEEERKKLVKELTSDDEKTTEEQKEGEVLEPL